MNDVCLKREQVQLTLPWLPVLTWLLAIPELHEVRIRGGHLTACFRSTDPYQSVSYARDATVTYTEVLHAVSPVLWQRRFTLAVDEIRAVAVTRH